MSTDRQRDADLDRLLRAELQRDPVEAPDACPDAEMLAALVEGGVTADERLLLEAHVALCARCQETLAAMDHEVPPSAASSAPAAAVRRPWLWRGHLHWLIPVGAATALVVYVASKPVIAPYFTPTGPAPATQSAELRPSGEVPGVSGFGSRLDERPVPRSQTVPAPAPDASASKAAQPRMAAPPATPGRSERERATAPAFAPETTPLPSKGEIAAGAGNLAQRPTLDVEAQRRAALAQGTAAAPQAAVVAIPPPAPAVATEAVAVQAGTAGLASDSTATKSAAKVAVAEPASAAPAKGAFANRALPSAAAEIIVASAPGGAVQWRVGPEGAVWRSGDGGRTWYPQRSGIKAALLAAVAPSPTTCWAVGVDGTVLLTDDGERWERRPFPEKVDLVAVDARSAHEAAVTTRDGRRFASADRGATWTLQK